MAKKPFKNVLANPMGWLEHVSFGRGYAMRHAFFAASAVVAVLLVVQTGLALWNGRERALFDVSRQRGSEAKLAAAVIEEQLHRMTDVSASLATRVAFSDHVVAGNWEEAIKIMAGVSTNLPDVERVFITDKSGVLQADYPALPGVRGIDFSHRDWYRGVSSGWQTYVSEAYTRTAMPRINVVSIASPVRDRVTTEVVGILVLQIPLRNIYEWSSSFDFGEGSEITFVDKYGHLVTESKRGTAEPEDVSGQAPVTHLLRGESGTMIERGEGGETLTSYALVQSYDWGVIIRQPTSIALGAHSDQIRDDAIAAALFLLAYFALIMVVARVLRQLDVSRQMQKFIIESAGDCMVAIDKEWNVTLWNPKAVEVTGWTQQEALGQPLRKVLRLIRRGERTENVLFIADAMLHGTIQEMQDDTLLVRKDGFEIDVADSAAPVTDERGRVIGAVVIFRDVTREREAERSRADLIAMVTHELRTPAVAMKAHLEAYAAKWGASMELSQKEQFEQIMSDNGKVLVLANSLLNAFRTDFEDVVIDPEPVDITEVADAALNALQTTLNNRKLHVEKHFDADIPMMRLDTTLTEMLFENLLSNAVKFTADGGTVLLELSKSNDNVIVRVTDTGVGVPTADVPKVFRRFFRASNARGIGGVGIGLHVLKTMLERAGCRISFQSQHGKGSTFTVAIPIDGMRPHGVRKSGGNRNVTE